MHYVPDLKVVIDRMDVILLGLKMTLMISSVSMGLALAVGLIVALIRLSKIPSDQRIIGILGCRFIRKAHKYLFRQSFPVLKKIDQIPLTLAETGVQS